jgi:hypothetical protein
MISLSCGTEERGLFVTSSVRETATRWSGPLKRNTILWAPAYMVLSGRREEEEEVAKSRNDL